MGRGGGCNPAWQMALPPLPNSIETRLAEGIRGTPKDRQDAAHPLRPKSKPCSRAPSPQQALLPCSLPGPAGHPSPAQLLLPRGLGTNIPSAQGTPGPFVPRKNKDRPEPKNARPPGGIRSAREAGEEPSAFFRAQTSAPCPTWAWPRPTHSAANPPAPMRSCPWVSRRPLGCSRARLLTHPQLHGLRAASLPGPAEPPRKGGSVSSPPTPRT